MPDINAELEFKNAQVKGPGSDDLRRKMSTIDARYADHIHFPLLPGHAGRLPRSTAVMLGPYDQFWSMGHKQK